MRWRCEVVVVAVVAVLLIPVRAALAQDQDLVENLRARDEAAALLVQTGVERSQTFRRLVSDLAVSKVVVYVEVRHDPSYRMGGALTFIADVAGWRWVRATIDTGASSRRAVLTELFLLTGLLGHELQHAREVAAAPSIQDRDGFEAHFREVGIQVGPRSFDTNEAVAIGHRVAAELRGATFRQNVSDTVCDDW